MSDLTYTTIDECLSGLSLEELADCAICFMHDSPGVLVIPENQPVDRPLVVVTSQSKADEVNRYWRSVFGEVDVIRAIEMVKEWRRGQEVAKLMSHAEAHGNWLERNAKS